jgi:ABC-type sugar transport system ATPase subunit
MARKDFFNQDTLISPNEDLIILKRAKIHAKGIFRLEAHGKCKRLSNKAFGLGRDRHNAVIISDSNVSKYHATVQFKNGIGYITDTNSSNGTFINGKRIEPNRPVKLKNNDIIVLGKTKITYLC